MNLKSGQIVCSLDVASPTSGKQTTRVNWLLRQLKDAPATTRIESFVFHAREGAAELLSAARTDPTKLVTNQSKDIVKFRVAQLSAAGTKRGLGRGSFIESVVGSVDSFYEDIGQRIKPYVPPSPRYGELGAAEATPRDVASSKAETSSGSEIPVSAVANPAK